MEILLVDDEVYTIRILQTAIDWESHGVGQVWSALGVAILLVPRAYICIGGLELLRQAAQT